MDLLTRLVFLLLAASGSEDRTFLVVFPENIAYYHPQSPDNKVCITALHHDTNVNVSDHPSTTLQAGQNVVLRVNSFPALELGRIPLPGPPQSSPYQSFRISAASLKVSSNKDVAVNAFSIKKQSIQSMLVIPKLKLGTKHFIPPVPEILGTTNMQNVSVTERAPFRLIIVNSGEETSVNISGSEALSFTLISNQVAQIWVKNSTAPHVVNASKAVAVYFSHPCARLDGSNCKCSLLTTLVPPAKQESSRFPVPILSQKKGVLVSDANGRRIVNESEVQTSGTAILHASGLLLTLIPEEEFGSCFVVPQFEYITSIIIVVRQEHRGGIHVGNNKVNDDKFEVLGDFAFQNYSSIDRTSSNVVWHASHKMAVYLMGSNVLFGSPATVVSTVPDPSGCLVETESIKVLDQAASWQESIKSCRNQQMELIVMSNSTLQKQICDKLPHDSPEELWIGMRRSTLTGAWYWHNKEPVNDSNWGPGEPGALDKAQCVAMYRNNSSCSWKHVDCCKEVQPLCFSQKEFLHSG